MLINDFSTAFNRPMQMDTLTPEEIESMEETSKELVSDDFLSLHKERGIGDAMRSLKVSARAFIHADETCINGYDVRGSFWVSQDLIKTAKLESEPAREWQATEKKLTGIPFNAWKEQIYV
jgi:hypothetical protein